MTFVTVKRVNYQRRADRLNAQIKDTGSIDANDFLKLKRAESSLLDNRDFKAFDRMMREHPDKVRFDLD